MPEIVIDIPVVKSMPNERERQADLAAATQLIADSGIFDADHYRKVAGPDAGKSPIEHYLKIGWRSGLEPSPTFEGRWLYPYYASAGLLDPPALTYATLGAAQEPAFPNRAAAEKYAAIVRSSDLFDAEFYAKRADNLGQLDPALHYVIVGERLGLAPSAKFDPAYYLRRYPDIARSTSLLDHYLSVGLKEGRRPLSVASELKFDNSKIDPSRETVLIVTHQASRTGAPILAYNIAKRLHRRYNIVTLVLLGGELYEDFESCSDAVIGPVTTEVAWVAIDGVAYVEGECIARRLKATYDIKYAIVNSIDSRTLLKPLTCELIPTVTLVHEFAADVRQRNQPPGEMGRWLEWTNEIVFSAEIVAASVRDEYPHLVERPVHILPQGMCELPPRNKPVQKSSAGDLRQTMRPPGAEKALVVLGCGTVFARKGVDLFVACAEELSRLKLEREVHFVWIGSRYDPARDDYSRRLNQRIASAGLTKTVRILNEVTDLEPAYASADVFFLSSRLDPLPNVAIDSAMRGLPIVSFDSTGGIADMLAADPATRESVMPHLDVKAAARFIARLAHDEPLRSELGRATQRIARATFDMERYVDSLDRLGRDAEDLMRQRAKDFEVIRDDGSFDMSMFLDPYSIETTRDESIRLFLARAGALATSTQPTSNFFFRRPCPGFHPQIYVHQDPGRYDTKAVNSLAHFIRSGKPAGPWSHHVITPDVLDEPAPAQGNPARIAIHGHFYYPDLVCDFLEKLSINSTKCDLLLSTNDKDKADFLRRAAKGYKGGDVVISVFPNRGRDIGAFLTGFAREIADYDVIGHIHGKRSLHTGDELVGEKWREFLWQNLLGGLYPMIDAVIRQFAKDARLGLVFADDPHLSDWDLNRKIAEELARKIGRTDPLPPYFDFPIGTMFWARTSALEPLFRLNYDWSSYPEEPAPLDGTVLHAIERMLPFVSNQAGYRYATTFIPGMTW